MANVLPIFPLVQQSDLLDMKFMRFFCLVHHVIRNTFALAQAVLQMPINHNKKYDLLLAHIKRTLIPAQFMK